MIIVTAYLYSASAKDSQEVHAPNLTAYTSHKTHANRSNGPFNRLRNTVRNMTVRVQHL